LESAGRAGTGVDERRSQGKGVGSRPGQQLFLSFLFVFVFCFCSDGGERGGLTSWPRPGGGIPLYICHGRKAAVRNMKKQTNKPFDFRGSVVGPQGLAEMVFCMFKRLAESTVLIAATVLSND
jgi:hypothetical protein